MNHANGNEVDELNQEQGIDLLRYWKIIFAKRWMIIGLTVAITAVSVAVILALPSRYQATASLVFEVDQSNPVSVEEIYDLGSQRRDYLLTQTEMLQSRQLAERVILRLNLMDNPEFSGRSSSNKPLEAITGLFKSDSTSTSDSLPPLNLDDIATAFLKRLTIEPSRNTNLVRVKFEAKSAKLAAQVANATVEEFIALQSEAKNQFTSRATSWLNERLEKLHQKLDASEKNLQAFRESEDLLDISGVNGLSERDLNTATAQLQDMRRELKQIDSVFAQFKRNQGNEIALANLPEVISNPLIQEIKRNEAVAERNVAELARRYKSKHPEMVAASNELKMVRSQLANEVRIIAKAIESQYNTALARVQAQELEVERAKENYQNVSQKEFRYQELVREVEVNRQLYDTFFTRVNETREASGFEISPARLVDSAVAPRQANKPNKKLLAGMALIASLVFSTALALLLDFLHLGVRSPEDVEVYLGQRLIGLLPKVTNGKDGGLKLGTYFDPDQYTFSEAVRTLRTGVVLTGLGKTIRVIMVTSSVPDEGKSTVAENLAFAMSQVERVLLIDADLRKPTIGTDFGIGRESPGLTNLIQGTCSVDECVHAYSSSGLSVMSAGTYLPDPQRLIVAHQFSDVITQLAENYDRIIIDTPPIQAVSDALIISHLADAILYVVKYDSTNKRTVNRAIGRLTQVGSKIDGVVLTHVDTSKDAIYADEYYDYNYGKGLPAYGSAEHTQANPEQPSPVNIDEESPMSNVDHALPVFKEEINPDESSVEMLESSELELKDKPQEDNSLETENIEKFPDTDPGDIREESTTEVADHIAETTTEYICEEPCEDSPVNISSETPEDTTEEPVTESIKNNDEIVSEEIPEETSEANTEEYIEEITQDSSDTETETDVKTSKNKRRRKRARKLQTT